MAYIVPVVDENFFQAKRDAEKSRDNLPVSTAPQDDSPFSYYDFYSSINGYNSPSAPSANVSQFFSAPPDLSNTSFSNMNIAAGKGYDYLKGLDGFYQEAPAPAPSHMGLLQQWGTGSAPAPAQTANPAYIDRATRVLSWLADYNQASPESYLQQGLTLQDIKPKIGSSGGVGSYMDAYISGKTPKDFGQDSGQMVRSNLQLGASVAPGTNPGLVAGGGAGTDQFASTGFSGPDSMASNTFGASNPRAATVNGGAVDAGMTTMGMRQPQGFANGGLVGATIPDDIGMGSAMAYADGGMIGMPQQGATPQAPGMAPPQAHQPIPPQMADAQIQDMLMKHPEVRQQITQVIQQAFQSGQISPQQAQLAAQLAQACINNPALWPQIRNFAISNGLAGPSDLPEQYDQGLVLTILIAARAVNDQGGGQAQGFANGGQIVGPGTGRSDSIPGVNQDTGAPVKVSNGEYVIPEHIVRAKGTEFFDKLLQQYNPNQPQGGNGNVQR
jgi:hypothetical protein